MAANEQMVSSVQVIAAVAQQAAASGEEVSAITSQLTTHRNQIKKVGEIFNYPEKIRHKGNSHKGTKKIIPALYTYPSGP